ncbi:MAG: TlpA disulfide reductase family protein [Bacteroidota bacterium]|nr:TlpA disulfide reductase family protein [Bacteroidota bacterium]
MNSKKPILVLSLLFFFNGLYAQQLPNITDNRVQIKLPTVKGDSLSLASLKGQVILLDFWASWCGPCRASNKQLVKLYARYKAKGFEIFSVSLDQDKRDWQKAIAKDKISWLQVNDPRGWNAQTAIDWNISQIPTSFLINKKGDVVSIDPEGRELEESVKKLLTE